MEPLTLSHNPVPRFTSLIEELCRVLHKHTGKSLVDAAMLVLIWNRLTRLARRFAILVERVQAGTLADPAPPRSRGASAPPPPTPDQPSAAPRELLLPHHFRWLVNMIPETERFAPDLCWQLQQAEMWELVFAAPRQAGRILRPLCKMLGVDPPSMLQPRPVPVPTVEQTFEPEPEPDPEPAQPADDSSWTQWHEPEPPSETEAEDWKFDPPERPPKNPD